MSASPAPRAYISGWNETKYTEFYGFTEEPFDATVDPGSLFLSRSSREALAAITDGIERKKGFITVTGEAGVGKTMILRAFLAKADRRRFKIVSLLNPNLSFREMMNAILLEFGFEEEPGGVYDRLTRLHSALIEEDKQGRTVVLILDGAQGIPLETLKDLRMLSNLEASSRKLIQVILIGQPDFKRLLGRDELRQFRQRVAVRCKIAPLSRGESIKYIKHRLSRVTFEEEPVFTRWALRNIVARTGGIPRAINILCDHVLMAGFGQQRKPITSGMAKKVVADLEGKGGPKTGQLAGAAVAALLFVVALAWWSPLKEIIPLRGPSQVGARGMVISPIKEKASQDPTPETGSPSVPRARKEGTARLNPEVDSSGKSRGLEGTREYRFPQIVTVKEGDNLFRLTMKSYGYVDEELMEWVLINNPQIVNPTRISVGQRIVFREKPLDHESPEALEGQK